MAVSYSKIVKSGPKLIGSYYCHLGDVDENFIFTFTQFITHLKTHLIDLFESYFLKYASKGKFPLTPGYRSFTPYLFAIKINDAVINTEKIDFSTFFIDQDLLQIFEDIIIEGIVPKSKKKPEPIAVNYSVILIVNDEKAVNDINTINLSGTEILYPSASIDSSVWDSVLSFKDFKAQSFDTILNSFNYLLQNFKFFIENIGLKYPSFKNCLRSFNAGNQVVFSTPFKKDSTIFAFQLDPNRPNNPFSIVPLTNTFSNSNGFDFFSFIYLSLNVLTDQTIFINSNTHICYNFFQTIFYYLCIASTESPDPVVPENPAPLEIQVEDKEEVIEELPEVDNYTNEEIIEDAIEEAIEDSIEEAVEDTIDEHSPTIPNLAPPAGIKLQDYKNKRNRYQDPINKFRLTQSLKLEPVPHDFFANRQDWSSVKERLDINKVQSLFAPLADLTIAEASALYFLPVKNSRDQFFNDNPLKNHEDIPHFLPYSVRPTKHPETILAAAKQESEMLGQTPYASLQKFDYLKTKYNKDKAFQSYLNNTFTKSDALESLSIREKSGFISYRVVLRVIIYKITPFINERDFPDLLIDNFYTGNDKADNLHARAIVKHLVIAAADHFLNPFRNGDNLSSSAPKFYATLHRLFPRSTISDSDKKIIDYLPIRFCWALVDFGMFSFFRTSFIDEKNNLEDHFWAYKHNKAIRVFRNEARKILSSSDHLPILTPHPNFLKQHEEEEEVKEKENNSPAIESDKEFDDHTQDFNKLFSFLFIPPEFKNTIIQFIYDSPQAFWSLIPLLFHENRTIISLLLWFLDQDFSNSNGLEYSSILALSPEAKAAIRERILFYSSHKNFSTINTIDFGTGKRKKKSSYPSESNFFKQFFSNFANPFIKAFSDKGIPAEDNADTDTDNDVDSETENENDTENDVDNDTESDFDTDSDTDTENEDEPDTADTERTGKVSKKIVKATIDDFLKKNKKTSNIPYFLKEIMYNGNLDIKYIKFRSPLSSSLFPDYQSSIVDYAGEKFPDTILNELMKSITRTIFSDISRRLWFLYISSKGNSRAEFHSYFIRLLRNKAPPNFGKKLKATFKNDFVNSQFFIYQVITNYNGDFKKDFSKSYKKKYKKTGPEDGYVFPYSVFRILTKQLRAHIDHLLFHSSKIVTLRKYFEFYFVNAVSRTDLTSVSINSIKKYDNFRSRSSQRLVIRSLFHLFDNSHLILEPVDENDPNPDDKTDIDSKDTDTGAAAQSSLQTLIAHEDVSDNNDTSYDEALLIEDKIIHQNIRAFLDTILTASETSLPQRTEYYRDSTQMDAFLTLLKKVNIDFDSTHNIISVIPKFFIDVGRFRSKVQYFLDSNFDALFSTILDLVPSHGIFCYSIPSFTSSTTFSSPKHRDVNSFLYIRPFFKYDKKNNPSIDPEKIQLLINEKKRDKSSSEPLSFIATNWFLKQAIYYHRKILFVNQNKNSVSVLSKVIPEDFKQMTEKIFRIRNNIPKDHKITGQTKKEFNNFLNENFIIHLSSKQNYYFEFHRALMNYLYIEVSGVYPDKSSLNNVIQQMKETIPIALDYNLDFVPPEDPEFTQRPKDIIPYELVKFTLKSLKSILYSLAQSYSTL